MGNDPVRLGKRGIYYSYETKSCPWMGLHGYKVILWTKSVAFSWLITHFHFIFIILNATHKAFSKNSFTKTLHTPTHHSLIIENSTVKWLKKHDRKINKMLFETWILSIFLSIFWGKAVKFSPIFRLGELAREKFPPW